MDPLTPVALGCAVDGAGDGASDGAGDGGGGTSARRNSGSCFLGSGCGWDSECGWGSERGWNVLASSSASRAVSLHE